MGRVRRIGRMGRLLGHTALLVFAASCASMSDPAADGTPAAGPRSDGLIVEVENDNSGDFEILLVRDGSASRLGVVSSSGFARFEVERARFSGQGQVALQVRSLVGRDQYTSPTVLVNRGEYLVLTLSPELRFSQLTVRR